MIQLPSTTIQHFLQLYQQSRITSGKRNFDCTKCYGRENCTCKAATEIIRVCVDVVAKSSKVGTLAVKGKMMIMRMPLMTWKNDICRVVPRAWYERKWYRYGCCLVGTILREKKQYLCRCPETEDTHIHNKKNSTCVVAPEWMPESAMYWFCCHIMVCCCLLSTGMSDRSM